MRILAGLFSFIFFILSVPTCLGQGDYVPPKIPGKVVKEVQNAVLISQSGQTDEAIKILRDIIVKYPTWTEPRQALSRIYYDTGKKLLAIEELESTLTFDTLSQMQQLYSLGRLYEDTNQPQKAMACYEALIRIGGQQPELVERARASNLKLEKKSKLWEETYTIDLKPLSPEINTPNHESLGRWTLDGQKFVFTRLLNGQEDIFIASEDSANQEWSIKDFGFNTEQNEGAHAISPSGKILIITFCNRPDGLGSCDLYLSVFDQGKWTTPVNMGPPFNSPSWEGRPCFGLDGLSLFFSSSRPGGLGGRDIWYVYQIAIGKWSGAINLLAPVNSPNNEDSPFIHYDGQTIYFMRDGEEGLGGNDLFMARKGIDGRWNEAENLCAPINSGADEGALSLHPDGSWAVMTRETETQRNDLFEFQLPEKFKASPLQALHVTIRDMLTQKMVRGRLEIFEVDQLDTIRTSQWADEAGEITVALQRNKNYGVICSAEGYIMHSSNLEADDSAFRNLDIQMTRMATAVDSIIVLENVFFETGSSELLSTSDPELNRLLWTLRNYVNMKIEIRGHTDDVGEDQSNQILSEERAKAVFDYLTGKGIGAFRVSYKGFGESQPVSDNATMEGRKKNRRTEFKVIFI